MTDAQADFQTINQSEVHADIRGVLEPGEEVYWQEEPPRRSLLPKVLIVLALLGGLLWQEGYIEDPQALVEGVSASALVLMTLLPLALLGGLIGVHYYRRDASVYALTSLRVMRLFRGRIAQQATPESLQLRGPPKPSSVRWHHVDYPPDSESRGRYGFANVGDGIGVHRLLEAWQRAKLGDLDEEALAGSDAFRRQATTAAARPDAEPAGAAAAAGSIRRIQHPEHGFSMDVPADWDAQVGWEHEGPLKVFGITLIRRALRPASLKPLRPGDADSWNRLVVRGGPSVGLTVKVNPGRTYDEHEVLHDRVAEHFDIGVKFIERDVDFAGFRGFSVVRDLPAGSSPMGFGTLPLPVTSRQWWLERDDLNLEIHGVAPSESTTLQETIDLIVGSLRPEAP